jgi:glycosyltransferase involved in cell wall biosynthesis
LINRCSIVIRAYNEEEHLGRLLTGIGEQSQQPLEVILVDSGSIDRTLEIARSRECRFPVRIFHIQPEEFSFGRSLNIGISEARGEFIVMASAHVYPVYPDWIENLLKPFRDDKIALAFGKQRGNSKTKFSEHQIFARWYPPNSYAHQNSPFSNNANSAIRRSLWELHPYDETLPGLEDLAWAKWALENGHSIAYVAEAEIVHVHEDSPMGVYNRYRREAMALKRIYPQEKFKLLDFIRLVSSNIAIDIHQAARQKVLSGNLKSILWFRLMQFWGTYKGFRQVGPLTWELKQTFYYPRLSKSEDSEQSRKIHPIQYNNL